MDFSREIRILFPFSKIPRNTATGHKENITRLRSSRKTNHNLPAKSKNLPEGEKWCYSMAKDTFRFNSLILSPKSCWETMLKCEEKGSGFIPAWYVQGLNIKRKRGNQAMPKGILQYLEIVDLSNLNILILHFKKNPPCLELPIFLAIT